MTICIGISAAILLFVSPAFCQEIKSPISFEAPKAWTLVEKSHDKGAHQFVYSGSNPKGAGPTKYPATAMVQYFELPPEGSPSDIDWIAESRRGADTPIDCAKDGANWKTFIWISYKEKQQIITLYRIGILDGYGVEFRYSFHHQKQLAKDPLLLLALTKSFDDAGENGGIYTTKVAMTPMIDEFNSLCETLKINKKNKFATMIRLIDPPHNGEAYRKVN